ncbi:MAG: hypothetical protein GY862_07055 [Gammaproteobacteria bacterium]|nr:hypothetical protein [Gammaproteobacteria bacterium]
MPTEILDVNPLPEESATEYFLRKLLSDLPPGVDLTMVGGSALVFWTKKYVPYYPQFFDENRIVTTKDIDFIGLFSDAEACSRHLGGKLRKPDMNHFTPELAVLSINQPDSTEPILNHLSK